MLEVKAYAKVNLSLDIVGRREDGYHLVRMVMQSLDIADILTFEKLDKPEIMVLLDNPSVGSDGDSPLGKVPLAALAAALLFAGLIALCMSRRLQTAGHFIGGAMAAAGLLTALTLLPVKMLNLRGMLAEASGALTAQSAHLERILTLESLGCAVLLIIAGVLLMLLAKKEYARHEG